MLCLQFLECAALPLFLPLLLCCELSRDQMRRFKLAKDSGAIWVDKPVTEKEMLGMALQGVTDMQQQLQQGLLELRQEAQKQLQASSTTATAAAAAESSPPPAAAAAAAAAAGEPPPAAAGSSHGQVGLQQQRQQQPVSEEEELAAILQQLKCGPDGLSAAQLAELQQQREELVAAEEEAAAEADGASEEAPAAESEVSGSALHTGFFCRDSRRVPTSYSNSVVLPEKITAFQSHLGRQSADNAHHLCMYAICACAGARRHARGASPCVAAAAATAAAAAAAAAAAPPTPTAAAGSSTAQQAGGS
jgi:hypothetical protein